MSTPSIWVSAQMSPETEEERQEKQLLNAYMAAFPTETSVMGFQKAMKDFTDHVDPQYQSSTDFEFFGSDIKTAVKLEQELEASRQTMLRQATQWRDTSTGSTNDGMHEKQSAQGHESKGADSAASPSDGSGGSSTTSGSTGQLSKAQKRKAVWDNLYQ